MRRLRAELLLGLLGLAACDTAIDAPASAPTAEPPPIYQDVTSEVGVAFIHHGGATGQWYFCEPVGPGTALFDYDNDGDLDLYLVQGGDLGPGVERRPSDEPQTDRLLRNERDPQTGEVRFVDVTEAARLHGDSYGMGVCTGDYDNDGDVDLHLTAFGKDQLWRNEGDGTFLDVTAAAGVGDERWTTCATFVDVDGDGWLDLFVGAYTEFSYANHKPCFGAGGGRDYCGPKSYAALPDRLYRNRGDGTFEDVSLTSGIAAHFGAALGVVAGDFDGDGRADLFVANDGSENQLWLGRGEWRFEEGALLAGCALDAQGRAEAGMGVDAADFDADGDEDLFLAHLATETNTLYVNNGRAGFTDRTDALRLAAASRPYTGFGTTWTDFDLDGWPDLIVANGEVRVIPERAAAGDRVPLGQRNLAFRNHEGAWFEDVSARAGESFALPEIGRGLAVGDIDGDGDEDVVLTNNHGPTRVLLCAAATDAAWISLDVRAHGRAALGARVEVVRGDGSSLWRTVRSSRAYLSSSDPRIVVGLGADTEPVTARVQWVGGAVEEFTALPLRGIARLVAGEGRTPTDAR